MKNIYLLIMYSIVSALAVIFGIGSFKAYCAVIELRQTSYINSAILITPYGTYNDVPGTADYADAAFYNSPDFRAEIKRGSDIFIQNNYMADEGGIHSQLAVSLDGFSKGKINVAPGFVTGSASSLAEYGLMITGGTGSFDAGLSISSIKDTYKTSPSYEIDLFDAAGQNLFKWENDDSMSLQPVSLNFNELYYIKAFSETNLFESKNETGFDYESSLIFGLDAVQVTAVPIPSAIFLFIPGLMSLLGLKKWAVFEKYEN